MKNILQKPSVLFSGQYTQEDLNNFKKNNEIIDLIDIFDSQIQELESIGIKHEKDSGNWIYFPWSKTLVHTVNEAHYLALRTNRNRDLITEEEQQILINKNIGFTGLSVGNAIVTNLVYQGIGKTMRIADNDILETTNLNRIKTGLHNIGKPKTDIALREIYEVNPYINLNIFSNGINKNNVSDFFVKNGKLDLVFDEIDSFDMKINLRIQAKKNKVPLLMFTNLGDRVLVDVERYDTNIDLQLFNGHLSEQQIEEILSTRNPTIEQKNNWAIAIVGKENIPQRALDSAMRVGKGLVGRPQLISTITVSAGLATYFAREILLGTNNVNTGRKLFRFNNLLE